MGGFVASRRTLIGIAIAGLAFGVVVAWLTLGSDHVDDRGLEAALALLVGWSFIGTGLFAWWRRPENRTGLLMVAVGFAWFATSVSASDDDLVFTFGIAVDGLFPALLGHLLLAFPTGRLATPLERALIGGVYLVATVLQVPSLLFEVTSDPDNLLMVSPDQDLSDLFDALQFGIAFVLIAVSFWVIVRRGGAVGVSQRAALAPVLWTGGATFGVWVVAQAFDAAGSPQVWLERLDLLLFATVPFGFLAGLLRSRLAAAAAVSSLVAQLSEPPGEGALRAALAEALGDPSLALAYWLPESERFVDWAGHPMELRDGEWTEVEVHGRRVAAIVHHPSLNEEPQLVRTAGAAAALALENQRLSAELRARIEELRASRARLVEATDAERRRLERDLHDGAQSRLVALSLHLRLMRRKLEGQPEVAEMADAAAAELQASLDELRELARGIHPAVLSDRGLEPALQMLAGRAPVPVEVRCDPPAGLPPAVETAIYFVVAEALTNVAKYAQATDATVTVTAGTGRDSSALAADGVHGSPDDSAAARGGQVTVATAAAGAVVVEITDDGRGGADIAAGSGLRGLADRLAALDGRIEVESPPGAGTRVRAEIPTGQSVTSASERSR